MSNILAFLAGHLLAVQGVVSGAAVTVLGPPSKTTISQKRCLIRPGGQGQLLPKGKAVTHDS